MQAGKCIVVERGGIWATGKITAYSLEADEESARATIQVVKHSAQKFACKTYNLKQGA